MTGRSINAVSALDALVGSIRDRVLAGEFVPDAPLSDVELAAEYGVARPTLRAAIQELVHEGLISRQPRRRASVPRLTADDIRDIFIVRVPLELRAVELVAGRPDVLEAPAAAVKHFVSLGRDASYREIVDADMGFHNALVAAAGSVRLRRAYAALDSELRLVRAQLLFPEETGLQLGEEHAALFQAISAGPARAARREMLRHLEQSLDLLTKAAP
jgi:DNA-binding GntR family transcriptional regulator